MPLIQEHYEIEAPPAQVFDLINDIEHSSDYSGSFHRVQNIGPDLYQFTIRVIGISLTWSAKVTGRLRPERISWESTGEVSSLGFFMLSPSTIGTHVIFEMEFNLRNRMLALLLKPVLPSIIKSVAADSMKNIQKRLNRPE